MAVMKAFEYFQGLSTKEWGPLLFCWDGGHFRSLYNLNLIFYFCFILLPNFGFKSSLHKFLSKETIMFLIVACKKALLCWTINQVSIFVAQCNQHFHDRTPKEKQKRERGTKRKRKSFFCFFGKEKLQKEKLLVKFKGRKCLISGIWISTSWQRKEYS